MNGVRSIVILLSLELGSVRVAITAGTVQPNPISIGTMLRPESPIFRRGLSITKATLAIYPLSSRSDRKKNIVTIIGRKLSTLPTPSNIPSITRLLMALLTLTVAIAFAAAAPNASIPFWRRSCRNGPITAKVRKNTAAITAMNTGMAVYLPVRTLSYLLLLICSLLSFGFFIHRSQTL